VNRRMPDGRHFVFGAKTDVQHSLVVDGAEKGVGCGWEWTRVVGYSPVGARVTEVTSSVVSGP